MELLTEANNFFWSEKFWLPPNCTWSDLERSGDVFTPQGWDLFVPFPLAICLFVLRLIWESLVAKPVGRWFNIKESPPRPAAPNATLEAAFKTSKYVPSHSVLQELAKKTDLTERQIERWWRRRRTQSKPSEMQRFTETSWRWLFYTAAFWYGLIVLWQKSWFWDTKHCWYGYPRQNVDSDIYWYYMVELAFYWSLILSLFIDNKRKDFAEMMIHHAVTISLMLFSWVDNMIRIGSLVLLVHDACDPIMECADGLFLFFTLSWFVTRLVIYPFRVVNSSFLESWEIIGPFISSYLFNALLFILQVLHLIWFHTILRMLFAYVIKGQVDKDDRSETEPESTDDETKHSDVTKEGVMNNNKSKLTNAYHSHTQG